jgi:hypothetical protein
MTPFVGAARDPLGARIGSKYGRFFEVFLWQAIGALGPWAGRARRQQIVDADVVVHPDLQ